MMSIFEHINLIRLLKEKHQEALTSGNDFCICEVSQLPLIDVPFKIHEYGCFVCLQGEAEGSIDLMPYHLKAGSIEVKTHYRKERKVQFYADSLHISIGHLFAVIKRVSGKSPGDWIDEYVVSEACALLKGSNLTILQISQELVFPSLSFFGKYFKHIKGISPKEYRER